MFGSHNETDVREYALENKVDYMHYLVPDTKCTKVIHTISMLSLLS